MSCKFERNDSYNDIKEYYCKKFACKDSVKCTKFNQPKNCYEEE